MFPLDVPSDLKIHLYKYNPIYNSYYHRFRYGMRKFAPTVNKVVESSKGRQLVAWNLEIVSSCLFQQQPNRPQCGYGYAACTGTCRITLPALWKSWVELTAAAGAGSWYRSRSIYFVYGTAFLTY